MKSQTKLVTIPPKRAEELLAFNTYAGQRNKSARHIQELAGKMMDGRFHVGSIALVHNGGTIMADGQHQCYASVSCGKPFKANLQEYYVEESDTKEDIARVFSQFNVDRARSRGDIAWIHGCQIGMDQWPRRCVTLCNTAIGWIESGFGASATISLSKDDNATLLGKYRKHCQFVFDTCFASGGKNLHLLRSPVVAAMIQTWTKSKGDAELFWSAVRDGDMLKSGEPAFVLRDFLMRSSVAIGCGSRNNKTEQVGQREMYARCLVAWNAFRAKETRTTLRWNPKGPLPKVA